MNQTKIANDKNGSGLKLRDLMAPFIRTVPERFRPAILQKEAEWSHSYFKAACLLWSAWYLLLIFLSDFQKDDKLPYIAIRITLISISLLAVAITSRKKLSTKSLGSLSVLLGCLYMGSYLAIAHLPLPVRTGWVAILPATFMATGSRSGRNALMGYALIVTVGFILFPQQINTIYIISDLLFGVGLVLGSMLIKYLWMVSVVKMLEKEEVERAALQNEIRIFEALETFIPKALTKKIRAQLSDHDLPSNVISQLKEPVPQHMAVLYSDFRDYSTRSNNPDFIKNELVTSSDPIIQISESLDGVVQNRGDSLIAAFMDASEAVNVSRAVAAALLSSKSEFDRVNQQQRSSPDRYMIVSSGSGVFFSLGRGVRNEVTIAGRPADLAARIDELTKSEMLRARLNEGPGVLMDVQSGLTLIEVLPDLNLLELELSMFRTELRTYESEKRLYFLEYNDRICVLIQSLAGVTDSQYPERSAA